MDPDSDKVNMLIIGLVIGLVLGGVIGYLYSSGKNSGAQITTDGGGLSPEEVNNLTGSFVKENLLQPGLTASVTNVSERNGLYEVRLAVNTPQGVQNALLFVSKDGKLLFVNPPIDMTIPMPKPSAPAEEVTRRLDVDAEALTDDDPWEGNRDAKVMLVEFSDFQCPFCAKVHSTVQKIQETYGDRILFVYRDFPLSTIHPQAQKAAEAAQCAFEQGMFWEYHDHLFGNQGDWSGVGIAKFKEYAADLGLDTDAFNTCLDSGKYAHEVTSDLQTGSSLGVTGTPAFFVYAPIDIVDTDALKEIHNGQSLLYMESADGKNVLFMISGAQPYSTFQSVLEAALQTG